LPKAWLARLDLLKERFSDEHIRELEDFGGLNDGMSADVLWRSRESVRAEIKASQTFLEKYLEN
jgi:hypothetical protein